MRRMIGNKTTAAALVGGLLMLMSDLARRGMQAVFFPDTWLRVLEGALFIVFLYHGARIVFQLLRLPALPEALQGDLKALSPETKKRLATWILRHPTPHRESRQELAGALRSGAALAEPLRRWQAACRDEGRKVITEHAVRVGVATALSQNGALDSLAVLYFSFRTLRNLYAVWGLRPGKINLYRTFLILLGNTLLAGVVEEILPEDILVGTLGRLSVLFARSLLDGAMNAWLLLRFGLLAEYLILHGRAPSRETRRIVRKESLRLLTSDTGVFFSIREQAKTAWHMLSRGGGRHSQTTRT